MYSRILTQYNTAGTLPSTIFGTTNIAVYKVIWLTSDNIYTTTKDWNMLNSLVSLLNAAGAEAYAFGLGPNTHVSALNSAPANSLVVDIYGGACAGTLYEMGTTWYKNLKGSREVYTIFISPPSTDIRGLAWLPRAHDDDFSDASFTGLANPDQFLYNNGYDFLVTSGNLAEMANAILNEAVD
jgi:hypothetical protein